MQTKSITNNYIAIQGWMVEQLCLKGNELLAYALIHGFSQDGKNQFTGSLTYIQQWLNCAHSTAVLTLQSLVKKQLIKKHEIYQNNQKYCTYQAIIPATITQSQNQTTQSENPTPPVRKSNQTSPKTIHNNIDNIDNNITTPAPPTFETIWHTYAKGNPAKAQHIYNNLTPDQQHQIHHHLHGDPDHIGYLEETHNTPYRQNLQNYLTNQTYLQPLTPRPSTNITLL